uniref:Follicle cell protein 3C-1 n=1 Tax=Trichogramma kaykai TaxID=54128 RepID=A0ABD2XPR5_9HYME
MPVSSFIIQTDVKMYPLLLIFLLVTRVYASEDNAITVAATTQDQDQDQTTDPTTEIPTSLITSTEAPLIACTCGVFLSGSFKRGSKVPPSEHPALQYEQAETFPCSSIGNKMCTNKCLDVVMKHLPNSPNILCGSIDRDCHKERAYLFIKNCQDDWINTNLSAGREYCCKDGIPYKCPF